MSTHISTRVGELFVTESGSGPPTVFWHSLFVGQRSWELVLQALADNRRVILIDGPNHGRSKTVEHDFTIEDCAVAAGEVLDHLDTSGPVDWVGNAFGGHVGLILAATQPARVRTLVTIGTPVQALTFRGRWLQTVPLVQIYRVVGANGFIMRALTNALLGSEAVTAQPGQADVVMEEFKRAPRAAMLHAMRCLMLRRRDLRHLLPRITIPTLMLAARDDAVGWLPADAERAVATMPDATAGTLAGGGHIAPLLLDPEGVARRLDEFWANSRV